MLDYAVVVATRNRLDALRASVPLFLGQDRPPARLIIVDCSDEHGAVADYITEVKQSTSIPIKLIRANAANSSQQRNIGIQQVSEAVTMLPDDDSLWFPDTAEQIMTIYEKDTTGLIGGVGGIESEASPLANAASPQKAHSLSNSMSAIRLRNRFEDRFVPQPFRSFGQECIRAMRPRAARAGIGDLTFVESITGFRMSYRTPILRDLGFDPTMGSRVGYALGEDTDLAMRVQKSGFALVAAPGAHVFHNTHPGKRAAGFPYGFIWVFNNTYMYRKIFGSSKSDRTSVRRYLRYKCLLYKLRRRNTYYRDVAKGASAAMAEFDLLWRTPDDQLTKVYGEICDRVLA